MATGFDGSIEALREQSRQLAKSYAARQQWYSDVAEGSDVVQQAFQIWTTAIDQRQAEKGGIDEEGKIIEDSTVEEGQDEALQRAILVARILRNAVVGTPECQELCFGAVSSIFQLLWTSTSFAFENDGEIHALNKTLVELLSNVITSNDELQKRLWSEMLCKDNDGADESSRTGADLIARLMQSRDTATSTATQVLLLNCTLDSTERSYSLATSKAGAKMLPSMLELVQRHLAENDIETRDDEQQRLQVLYAMFANLFDMQLFGSMFSLLTPTESETLNSLISQPQLTLLRLLDSYLHDTPYEKRTEKDDSVTKDLESLISSLENLALWAEEAMKSALEGGSKGLVDPRLAEVHMGLILLLQCLITLGMKTENSEDSSEEIVIVAREILAKMRSPLFVRVLVSQFAPALSPFRPVSKQAPAVPPPGHSLTSTGAASAIDASESGPGLDNLKNNIVNLLGVLSYKRAADDNKAVLLVQDTVREAGGLFDVMNMTQLDEHNPYIRERAIFTLRNLLLGNQASQDLVAKLQPVPR